MIIFTKPKKLLRLRFPKWNLGLALNGRIHPCYHASTLPRKNLGVGIHRARVRFIEVWLEAMRAIDEFSYTFGTIERGFVIEHLLRATSIIAIWLISSGPGDSMHLPCFISDLNSAGVAHAASVARIRLPHKKLVTNMSDWIVNG